MWAYELIFFYLKNFHFILYIRNNPYLCNVKLKKETIEMNQMFIHILLCGIIILLGQLGGSECRA